MHAMFHAYLRTSLIKTMAVAALTVGVTLSVGHPAHARQTATSSLDRQAIEARVTEINPGVKIQTINQTPVAGLWEVIAGSDVMYLSGDGRYLLHGDLYDMEDRVNLTEVATAVKRAEILNAVPDDEKIIFRPLGQVKHVIRVFTDISCGYCQKLHDQIQDYLGAGIQVEYLAFPRGGEQSPAFAEMKAIWCADNKVAAFGAAMLGNKAASPPCADPVAKQYAMGDKLGIRGTPTMYTVDGVQMGGYLPADTLLKMLDAKAKAKARATAASETASKAKAP